MARKMYIISTSVMSLSFISLIILSAMDLLDDSFLPPLLMFVTLVSGILSAVYVRKIKCSRCGKRPGRYQRLLKECPYCGTAYD